MAILSYEMYRLEDSIRVVVINNLYFIIKKSLWRATGIYYLVLK